MSTIEVEVLVETPPEIAAARQLAENEASAEPRASHAHYDTDLGVVLVALRNGNWFGFSPLIVPELANATAEELSGVEVDPTGYGLHWERLDADVAIAGLMYEQLGVARWHASFLGRRSTEKKRAAARVNGLRGGRPSSTEPTKSAEVEPGRRRLGGVIPGKARSEGQVPGRALRGPKGRKRKP